MMMLTLKFSRLLLVLTVLLVLVVGGAVLVGQGIDEGWLVTYARREPAGHWTLREVDAGRGVSRAIFTDYRFPTEPTFSPDGAFIAWTVRDLNVLQVGTGVVTQYSACYDMAWAPDSRAFAYVCNGEMIVMTRDADDTFSVGSRLNSRRGDMSKPVWSPDGGQVAYQDYREGFLQLFIAERDGSFVQQVNRDVRYTERSPAWSPDSERLAFVSERDGNAEIYVIDRNGNNAQRLTINESNDVAPIWSPDGDNLLFLSDRRYLFGEFYIVDMRADMPDPLALDVIAIVASPPRWSPDGDRLVFISGEDGELYTVRTTGGGLRQLTNERASHRLP